MERLLKDATKLSGVEYDISNLADVYNAIHQIQENLGVSGATADEASTTFTGSFNAMKASAQNLLGNLAIGGDVKGSMEQLVETASTFLFTNAIPMVANIFTALPSAIKTGISKVAPKIKEAGKEIVYGFKDVLVSMLPSAMGEAVEKGFSTIKNIITTMAPVAQQVVDMFGRVGAKLSTTLDGAFGNSGGFIQTFADTISSSIPMMEGILNGLVTVLGYLMPVIGSLGEQFAEIFPSILSVVNSVVSAVVPIFQRLANIVQTLIPVVTSIIQTFAVILEEIFPVVSDIVCGVLDAVMPVISAFAGLIQQALPVVTQIISVFVGIIETIFPVVQEIFADVGGKLAEIISGIIVPIVQKLGNIFQKISPAIQSAVKIIASVLSIAWSIISPILDLLISTFELVWTILEPIIDALVDAFMGLWEKLEPVFTWLADGLAGIGNALGGVADWIGGGIDTVKGWLGFAYGKDRVPYDNYPAVLHQGEKVLTRNQADQYDRAMSTRGVQLTQTVQEVPKDDGSGKPTDITVDVPAPKPTNGGGNTVHIEKLADTVVIEKEADADKVVEAMITKFKKLVPNMT